jgi:hypothetical protein
LGTNAEPLLVGESRGLYLRVATINVGGWSDDKAIRVRQIVDHYQIEVLIATETRRQIDSVIPGKGRTLIVKGVATKKTGVAVISPAGKGLVIQNMSERIMVLRHPTGLYVVGVYAPTEQGKDLEKENFWELLGNVIESLPERQTTVVIGDFNAGGEESRHPTAFGNQRNLTMLMKFAEKYKFYIQEHGPTWISPYSASKNKEAPSRTLDRCLIRTEGDYAIKINIDFDLRPADHALLATWIYFAGIDRNKGRPFNRPIADIDKRWNELKKPLQHSVDKTPILNSINEFWKAKRMFELEGREQMQILSEDGRVLQNEEGARMIRDMLYELWGTGTGNWSALLLQKSPETSSDPPKEEEIINAIGKLKANTAMGHDRISPAVVKDNNTAVVVYGEIFRDIWKQEAVPSTWKAMRIRPIPKASAITLPKGVRPITCLSTSMKILNNVIIARYEQQYEAGLDDSQHAYRRNRSTTTAVGELINTIKRGGNTRQVAFLDMSKAYDSVTKDAIHRALDKWGLPAKERNLIVQQYRECEVYVEFNGYMEEKFYLERGIRQGCALSCMIFGLIISDVHVRMKDFIQKRDAGMISYSDDIVVHAKDELLLRVMVKVMSKILKDYGLALNEEKTQFFTFNLKAAQVETISWLGLDLTSKLTWENYAGHQIKRMKEAATLLQKILSSRRLELRAKESLQVIQSLVGCYVKEPGFVDLSRVSKDQMENELTRIIAKFTKMEIEKAAGCARKMMKSEEVEKTERTHMLCIHCGRPFRGEAGMTQHLLFCRLNPQPNQPPKERCPTCNEEFHSRGLSRHMAHCKKNRQV